MIDLQKQYPMGLLVICFMLILMQEGSGIYILGAVRMSYAFGPLKI